MSINVTLNIEKAFKYHQDGELGKAESIYREILNDEPDNPDALHLLGFLCYQTDRNDIAEDLIRHAIRINPENPLYHNNLGLVLLDCGRPGDAIACYQKAIDIKPDLFEAYNHLGNAFMALGQKNDAIKSYENAIRLKPLYAEAFNNLGIAFLENGEFSRAISSYREAINISPGYVEAHNNLGNAFHGLGKFNEAISCYRKMLEIEPRQADAYSNMGALYQDQGKLNEAMACYQKAIEINPQHAMSYNNLGNVFQEQGQLERAASCYQKAIIHKPDFAEAYNNFGIALQDQGREDDSIACYRKALEIEPDYVQACSHLVHQLQRTCSWQSLENLAEKLDMLTQKALKIGKKTAEQPFQNISRHADPELNFAVAKSWAADIKRTISAETELFPFNVKQQNKSKISVGYLSGNFKNHPMAHLMLGIFRLHSKESFKIYCYSFGMDDGSKYREKIQHGCDKFIDVRDLNYRETARAIYDDNIDILIDLTGHTKGNRMAICALRPAPVQVRYLGLAGTTGADFFDYIITDRVVTPTTNEVFYSEKFVYMPHCYQTNDNRQTVQDKNWLKKDFNLPEEGFVFCAFHQGYKIEPVMFGAWMNILRQVPGSILWLQENGDTTDNNLRNEARLRNIDSTRLVFSKRLPKDEHLSRLRLADLALDTRLVTGAATTSDALWMGVPVLTICGSHFASNMSASILSAVGMQGLVAKSLKEYEQLAVRLALDTNELETIRHRLVTNRDVKPLFDTERFVRDLEAAYREMYMLFSRGKKPARIEINDIGSAVRTDVQSGNNQGGTGRESNKIAFFCGPNDTFLGDIERKLADTFEIQRFKGSQVDEMAALMRWCDVAFFEWCEPLLVQASRLPKLCPVLCRIHGYEVFGNIPEQVNWDHVDKIIFVADHKRKIFNSKVEVPVEKQVIIRDGVDLDAFSPAPLKKNTKKLAVIGYINYRKGIPMLLQFYHELLKQDNAFRLYIRGDHQDSRYKMALDQMIRELNLSDKIEFVPWVPDLNGWLADKSHVLSFSLEESFHYAVGNGMAAGLKPVVHACTEAREIWPKEAIFRNLDEFLSIMLSKDYQPASYRQYVTDNGLDLDAQCRKLSALFQSFIPDKPVTNAPAETLSQPSKVQSPPPVVSTPKENDEVTFCNKQYSRTNNLKLLLNGNESLQDYMNLLWSLHQPAEVDKKFLIDRVQTAFHTILGSYFNIVTIPEYDKNIVLRACQLVNTPEAQQVLAAQQNNESFLMETYSFLKKFLPEGEKACRVTVDKTFDQLETYSPVSRVSTLMNALHECFLPLQESGYLSSFIIHGSMATMDYTLFSDVDTQLFLTDEVFASPRVLHQVAQYIKAQNLHLKLFDPIQHHGFFISTDLDCRYYPQSFLPMSTLQNGFCLLGRNAFQFKLRDCRFENQFAIWHTAYYFRETVVMDRYPVQPFDIKRFLSRFMMLPVFYLELFHDEYPYKRDSFNQVKGFLPTHLNVVMDQITELRKQWNPNVGITISSAMAQGIWEYAETMLALLAELNYAEQ